MSKPNLERDLIRPTNSLKSKGFGNAIKITDSAPEPVETAQTIRIQDVAEAAAEPEKVEPAPAPAPAQPDLQSQIQDAVQSALTAVVAPLQEQLDTTRSNAAALQAQLDAAQTQLVKAQADSATLQGLAKLNGSSITAPMVNTQTSTKSSAHGAADELVSLIRSTEASKIVANVRDAASGAYANHRDPSAVSRYLNSAFREAKASGKSWRDSGLVKDVESLFKANGFLGGKIVDAAGATTGTTAPPLFLDILSALVRETHQSTNVFWQFPITAYDPSSAPGKNVLVPRFANLAEPTSIADYTIATNAAYNSIGLAVGTGSDSQSLDVTSVPIGIAQYGLGRGTAVGTRPVFVPEFYEATSLLNLIDAVDSRLMQNYYRFEDLLIRQEFLKATTIVYNDRGTVTSTATDVGTGDLGTMTKEFLHSLYSAMFAAQIPSMPDGSYVLVLNPTAAAQLQLSLESLYAPPSPDQLMEATNTFRMAAGIEIGQLSGYLGKYCNFSCFVSNSFGVGAVDSVTVNTVTLGAGPGSQTMLDSFAFGMGAVGRGVALPVEVRAQGAPFELGQSFIWTSREGCSAMDVDSASSAPAGQQTRVYRVRNTRVAV
jgi:hypothetical protein